MLVDNGLKDGTIDEIMKIAEQNKFVKPVKVEVNQGYGFGILSGLKEANGDWLGWMHANLQSDPEIFIEMFKNAINEEDVFCIRVKGKTLFEWSMLSLEGYAAEVDQYIFIAMKDEKEDVEGFITKKCIELGFENYEVIILDYLTDGQATTAEYSQKYDRMIRYLWLRMYRRAF